MELLNQNLLANRWAPKKLSDIILPDRILDNFKEGLQQNYIFYGTNGVGKSSLARVLSGKYKKGVPFLELNTSLYTSVDDLRTIVEDFCKQNFISNNNIFNFSDDEEFNNEVEENVDDNIKYSKTVFLDEFDRASAEYQDALKGFIETYSELGIKFVFTTNNYDKITNGIKTRFISINFSSLSTNEKKQQKRNFFNRLKDVIIPAENIKISDEELRELINSKYPDFRSILNHLELIKIKGNSEAQNNYFDSSSLQVENEFIQLLLTPNNNYDTIYHFLETNFGSENITLMFNILSNKFIKVLMSKELSNNKLFNVTYTICDYSKHMNYSTDPLILGITTVGKICDIIHQ